MKTASLFKLIWKIKDLKGGTNQQIIKRKALILGFWAQNAETCNKSGNYFRHLWQCLQRDRLNVKEKGSARILSGSSTSTLCAELQLARPVRHSSEYIPLAKPACKACQSLQLYSRTHPMAERVITRKLAVKALWSEKNLVILHTFSVL